MPIARTFSAIARRSTLAAMRRCSGLYIVLLLFSLAVAFINPVRQMMFGDDWAYGLTTRHLLATGEYRLHDWATANMPVQIYWAALLAQVFGYSFVVLRFSTLLLFLVGLIALYWMLRDSGVKDNDASLLTLGLLSSPLVLLLSFTFQSDVQFLSWQILALWLYSRALQQQDYRLMALGSIAAFAAVGTRQFGVALVAGLFATWLLLERGQRLRKAPLYMIGLGLPLLMTLWQLSDGLARPRFFQRVRLAEQLNYLRDLLGFAAELLWRPAAILQYLGLYLLPLTAVLLAALLNGWWTSNGQNGQGIKGSYRLGTSARWLLAAFTAYITAGFCYGYFVVLPGILMPSLPWLLSSRQLLPLSFKWHLAVTLVTGGFAVGFGCLLSQRYLEGRAGRVLLGAECFLLLSGLALLGLQLLYVQFYDVYLIQFLPFAVVVLGKTLPSWPRWCKALTAVLCVAMLLVSSLWTRGILAYTEASWRAADLARSAGAAPQDVAGNMTWSCYYGAFDEWIADIGGTDVATRYSGSNRMHFAFFDFLHKRERRAQYALRPLGRPIPDNSWQFVGTVEYRDAWLRRRNIYVLVRQTRKESQ